MNKLKVNPEQLPVYIYTDGSSLGNPGPGGWAALLRWGDLEKEICRGYRATTNNRMEISGVLAALSLLTKPCQVHIYTDSRYVCDAIEKKWLQTWEKNGWRTADKKSVKNQDLWEKLRPLLHLHQVRFHWIKAHAGHPENERCDQLAKAAATGLQLDIDVEYERENRQRASR